VARKLCSQAAELSATAFKGIGWAIPYDRTGHVITTKDAEPNQNAAAREQYGGEQRRWV
jgi:hypothetical protein